MPILEYDRRGNLISATHRDGRPVRSPHRYSGNSSSRHQDGYYDRVADFYDEGHRLSRAADDARDRQRRSESRFHRRYMRNLHEGAPYYDPPEMYYQGRAETSGPHGGYGPPYDYYDGAWRDGYGHDVTDPPYYSRDDTTGSWSYSWPGRGRGGGY